MPTMLNRTRSELRGPAVRVATVGPVGRFPIAPGTAGSVVGVLIAALIARLPLGRLMQGAVLAGSSVLVYGVGVWAAGRAEGALQSVDPGPVVIDEVAGQMLTFLFRPAAGWIWLAGGFLLFRFFDVLKPFPARRSERLPGGWGIMTDDVAASAYSAVALFLLGLAVR